MTQPSTISADYTLRPSELASVLALLVEARQPCIVWGPPGAAKSMIAQQVTTRQSPPESFCASSSGGIHPQTSTNASGSAPDPRRKPACAQVVVADQRPASCPSACAGGCKRA